MSKDWYIVPADVDAAIKTLVDNQIPFVKEGTNLRLPLPGMATINRCLDLGFEVVDINGQVATHKEANASKEVCHDA